MPTFEDPKRDAAELSEAARGLAHASRQFTDPADSYAVLGELQSTLISLHQSLLQIAALHTRNIDRASTDDADPAAGRNYAFAAAGWLETAARDLDQATDQLMTAFAANGHIAWQPVPANHDGRTLVGELLEDRAAQLSTSDTETATPSPPAPHHRRPD